MKQLLITCDHCGDKYAYDFKTSKVFDKYIRDQGWQFGPCRQVHVCPRCSDNDIRPSQHAK